MSDPSGFAASFWQGLAAPSLASVAGAALFAAAELAALVALVTPRHLAAIDSSFVAMNKNDEYGRVTIDALKLKYAPAPGAHVVYIGPSTARLALVDPQRPEEIESFLTARVGEPVTFHNFTADGMTLEDAFVLLDYVPDHMRGVVVFTISDTRGARLREKERLGLDKPTLHGIAAQVNGDLGQHQDFHTGFHFLDHLGFFALRRGVLLRPGPVAVKKPVFDGRKAGPQVWARAVQVARSRNARVVMAQMGELGRIADTLQGRGIDLVVLEAPINPRFEALKPLELRDFYDAKMRDLVVQKGFTYWSLSEDAELTHEDFFDAVHVGMFGARERFQRVFEERLADHLTRNQLRAPPAVPRAPGLEL